MNAMLRRSVLLLPVLLAACAHYSLVDPGPNGTLVKTGLDVYPHMRWSKVAMGPNPDSLFYDTSGRLETWTIDGEKLDSLMFFAAVPDGQPLLTLAASGSSLPPFRSQMTPNEIMDLFTSSFSTATGSAVIQSRDLRPAKLGNVDGFRFEVDFTLKDDVDRELSAVGTVKDGKLYLIAFQGTKLYHYGKYLPDFEQIVATAQLT
jgi:hypothetical protein